MPNVTVTARGTCENGHEIKAMGFGHTDRPGEASFSSSHDLCPECNAPVTIVDYQEQTESS